METRSREPFVGGASRRHCGGDGVQHFPPYLRGPAGPILRRPALHQRRRAVGRGGAAGLGRGRAAGPHVSDGVPVRPSPPEAHPAGHRRPLARRGPARPRGARSGISFQPVHQREGIRRASDRTRPGILPEVTKAIHNALHGTPVTLTTAMQSLFLDVVDVSHPQSDVWDFLREHVVRYDAPVFSAPEFSQVLSIPQYMIHPAIDPLAEKNRDMTTTEIEAVLPNLGIRDDRPIVTQVSRFDRLKDPLGVIRAYQLVRRTVECQLVLAGGGAADDPEGAAVLEEVRRAADLRLGPPAGQRPGDQRLAAGGDRRGAEVPPGGVRPHGHRGPLEAAAGRRLRSRRKEPPTGSARSCETRSSRAASETTATRT